MSTCPRCGTQFTCAIADQTHHPCWCTTLPAEAKLPIYPELFMSTPPSCLCPACLTEYKRGKALQESA